MRDVSEVLGANWPVYKQALVEPVPQGFIHPRWFVRRSEVDDVAAPHSVYAIEKLHDDIVDIVVGALRIISRGCE